MPFVGIISKENDSNFIKNTINKQNKTNKFEIVNINTQSIGNIKNIKFDILVINENIENILNNSNYLETLINKACYIIINSDIKNNLKALKNIKTNIITYGFNAKATITISSVRDENMLICIQRGIKDIENNKIDEQEFNIGIEKNNVNKLYNILIIFTILAIYGEILQKI